MTDLKISDLLLMQKSLWEKYQHKWSPLSPQFARNSILWMIEELGEVIAIIKKRGEADIMTDETLRQAFTTELADVLMYFGDILLRYEITPEEISAAYIAKHNQNMERDFDGEHSSYLKGE
ncbi:MAG: nucleotide pyrophosphohydrolase [Defluviitaleaceae bacterium]|nr:nucleotide pyrophosphohydrolase [Defluviitaleaceae bacterium]